jgi:hypothetical protein
MVELSEIWSTVMNALIEGPVAWRSPADVASAVGLGEAETTDMLCELDVAGWVEVWDSIGGPLVTLSALAAERLAVRLVEFGPGETPRWARTGEPDPRRTRPKNVCSSDRAASLDYVLDPNESHEADVERLESIEVRANTRRGQPASQTQTEDLPRPTHLIGVGLTPWPGPSQNVEDLAKCPACGSRKLRPEMYCIYCDRWGLDGLLKPNLIARTDSARPGRQPVVESLQSEHERAKRKAKRKRRHQRQLEASRQGNSKARPERERVAGAGPATRRGPVSQPSSRFAQPPASRSHSASAS